MSNDKKKTQKTNYEKPSSVHTCNQQIHCIMQLKHIEYTNCLCYILSDQIISHRHSMILSGKIITVILYTKNFRPACPPCPFLLFPQMSPQLSGFFFFIRFATFHRVKGFDDAVFVAARHWRPPCCRIAAQFPATWRHRLEVAFIPAWVLFQCKDRLSRYWESCSIVFIIWIPMLIRQHNYIGTVPGNSLATVSNQRRRCWGTTVWACMWTRARALRSGLHLNIKAVFPRYGETHVKDKTVARLSYL